MTLTSEQKLRYNRHLILDGFGEEAQNKLMHSKVLLVGVGGLGSPVALYLAAAGVGTIGIVDGDIVSLSNLQRQVIHSTVEVGQTKVDSAEERIKTLNPDVQVVKYPFFISQDNASKIIADYDFVVEGSDNFATKYLVNDACVMLQKAFCIGGVIRYSGQIMTYVPNSACYRCLFPEPPDISDVQTCSMVGVLGSAAGMLGMIQATECIKFLTNIGHLLINTMLAFDALSMQWQRLEFEHNDDCALCGSHPNINELKEPCNKKKQ